LEALLAVPAETRTLEFKRLGSKSQAIEKALQSIVAMSNTDGGWLILGIDDPEKTQLKGLKRVFGIEENLELYDELGRTIARLSPPIAINWPPDLVPSPNGKRIAMLPVPKATDGFRSVGGHVYVRGEKSNKQLSPPEIVRFAYAKGFQRADREIVEVDFRILDTDVFRRWRVERRLEGSIDEVLEKTGLARRDEKDRLKPTRAAVLLFADFPSELMDTKCAVRVFQYHGKKIQIEETLNLVGKPRSIQGPLVRQIRDAHEYVLGLLRTGLQVPSGFRTQYRIPERAVKEAITNAVIHRDYHSKRDIEVRVFDDRLEVESPGLFPFNITLGNIGQERAEGYRNDLLVKHLREFPDPPNLDQNEGVKAMRRQMATAKLYPPVFATYPDLKDSVRVSLHNEKAPDAWEKVEHHLRRFQSLGNAEARKLLDIEDTVKVSKQLKRWVDQGLLLPINAGGAKQKVRYRLPNAEEVTVITSSEGKEARKR
jgi:ATP-dependent DNA helicase RecG